MQKPKKKSKYLTGCLNIFFYVVYFLKICFVLQKYSFKLFDLSICKISFKNRNIHSLNRIF